MADSHKVTSDTTEESEKNKVKTKKQNITRPMELILLFWIDENWKGRTMMAESAQTRMQNIKNAGWYNENIHKVHCPPIQALHEIGPIVQNWTNNYGGKEKIKTVEIGVFSHAGFDGPLTYLTANVPPLNSRFARQMAISGGWDAIDFNWKEKGAMIVFYGCNSGTTGSTGFALRISKLKNYKGVTVWGQSTSSYPSIYPDYRVTTPARNVNVTWDLGPTYMVGGNKNEVWKVSKGHEKGVFKLSPDDLKEFPPANPLNAFEDGRQVKTAHQGKIDDHRK